MNSEPQSLPDLSLRRRMATVMVGSAGALVATGVAMLWATEPKALPARTQVGFALIIAVGIAWVFYAIWRLRTRLPLLGRDSVLAGWIATGATVAGTAVAMWVGFERGWSPSAIAASGFAAFQLAAALLYLRRGMRRRRRLRDRRMRLQQELAGPAF